MKAIDRAKAHFDSLDIKKIEVPEWGDDDGNPLVIYCKPITLAETQKLYKLAREDDLAMMAYVVIYKALDAEGNKLFDLTDKNALLNKVDRDVLIKISTEMMSSMSDAQVKKN